MKTGGFLIGASAGLLIALLFVGGASLLGPSALHIDLVHAATSPSGQSGLSTPSGSQATVFPTGQVTSEATQASTPGPSISSVNALSTDSGTSLGLLFLPILLGVLIGAAFYGVFLRRTYAE